jgi:chromosomal replication initiation ATPase DnaA
MSFTQPEELRLLTAKTNLLTELNREDWNPANIRLIVRGLRRNPKIEVKDFSRHYKRKIKKMIPLLCRIGNISKASLFSKSRKGNVIYVRQLFIYILVTDLKQTLERSAGLFGLDHTTGIHARRKIQGYIDIKDKQTIEDLNLIRELL